MKAKKLVIIAIDFYKKTEPTRQTLARNLHLAPVHCRFRPTCSQYTKRAVEKYGVAKGLFLGAKRLAKCNFLWQGGVDEII